MQTWFWYGGIIQNITMTSPRSIFGITFCLNKYFNLFGTNVAFLCPPKTKSLGLIFIHGGIEKGKLGWNGLKYFGRKNGRSKTCGRHPLKTYPVKFFKGCLPQIFFGPGAMTLMSTQLWPLKTCNDLIFPKDNIAIFLMVA